MHQQSDSELELTDPCTSLFYLGFTLHLFCAAQFLFGAQTRPSVGVLGWHSGVLRADVLPCPILFVFSQLLHTQEFWNMRHLLSASRMLTVSLTGQESWTEKANILFVRVLLFSGHAPFSSTWSHELTRSDVWFCFFCLCLCQKTVVRTFAHGSRLQFVRCLVQKRIVRFVLAHIHGLVCCSNQNPESVFVEQDSQI